MHVGTQLRKARKDHGLTLKKLDSRLQYGPGNISNYENGNSNPQDPTLLRILTHGLEMDKEEAMKTIALWRKEEFDAKYGKYLKN